MTVEEIFTKLAIHMEEGTHYHQELANAYNFLGLHGNALCHFKHQAEETNNYQCLLHYYSLHYHRLLVIENIEKHEVIPSTWYKYESASVDSGTRKSAIKELMTKWVNWEKSTKKLYQEMRQELCTINEIAAAFFLDIYIKDVEKELCHAEKKLLQLEIINYDASEVLELDLAMKEKYQKKLGW